MLARVNAILRLGSALPARRGGRLACNASPQLLPARSGRRGDTDSSRGELEPPANLFSFEKSLVNCETPGHTQQLSAGKQRRKNYDSLNLVHCCWVDRGRDRKIGDARAHDDFLDNRARHHRIDYRRRRYPHVFAADDRTISSRRPHFFYTWRDLGSLHLH